MKQSLMKVLLTVSFLSALLTMLGCDCLCSKKQVPAKTPARIMVDGTKPWNFVVSGDSRNCGDVVMPAVAQGAAQNNAAFYWHLGDLRATYDFDEDILKVAELQKKKLRISDYVGDGKAIGEWDDFKQNQMSPFGKIPFFVGIGNHEIYFPQSRERFTKYFADSLDSPWLKEQRLFDLQKHSTAENPQDSGPKTYFHWIMSGVDFIYLDNASPEEFDADQVKWFETVLRDDREKESGIDTVVVGMHAALPNSLAKGHSMDDSADGLKSGEQIYKDLLDLQKNGKKVYVLASHSHFYMKGIFNTEYWSENGGELQGWIIGTAGAVRYRLPDKKFTDRAKEAKTDVYGYLLATVAPGGAIDFKFQEFAEKDIPKEIVDHYSADFVHWCFVENKKMK
jgi:hypothetical protein